MRISFIIFIVILTSCGTSKDVKISSQFSDDLVMNSIYDYADTKGKSFPKKSIFYVVVDSLSNMINVNIYLSDTRYFYKDESSLLEYPIYGSFIEIDHNLYHINQNMNYKKVEESKLIEFGLLQFNNSLSNYEVEDFNDDLKFIMKYYYCTKDSKRNFKVYGNSRKKINKYLKELDCGG